MQTETCTVPLCVFHPYGSSHCKFFPCLRLQSGCSLGIGYRLGIGLQTEHVNYLPLNLESLYFLFQQDQVIQLQNYNLAEPFVVCMLLFMRAIVMFVERWSIFDQFIISCILTCLHMRTCTLSLPCMHVHCSVNIYWTLLIYHILKSDADYSALTQHSHKTNMLLPNLPKTLTIVYFEV